MADINIWHPICPQLNADKNIHAHTFTLFDSINQIFIDFFLFSFFVRLIVFISLLSLVNYRSLSCIELRGSEIVGNFFFFHSFHLLHCRPRFFFPHHPFFILAMPIDRLFLLLHSVSVTLWRIMWWIRDMRLPSLFFYSIDFWYSPSFVAFVFKKNKKKGKEGKMERKKCVWKGIKEKGRKKREISLHLKRNLFIASIILITLNRKWTDINSK